jgi:DNA recombination protein RmuC
MDTSTLLALLVALTVGCLLGLLAGLLWSRSRSDPAERLVLESRAADHAVVKHGLESLHEQVRALHEQRVSWQAQLQQQVADMRHSTDLLRRETGSLATALRRPQVRGRWGELHLRRAVELAGLVARCDFDEQVTVRDADASALRPDLVVHLAGGKQVVVDAKVPLEAFLDATEAEDDDERAAHLARHARQFRKHVDALAAKAYWRSFALSPEFVVLFVPGESFLSAALESDGHLIEYAAERKVVLATPTTVIALLRTVAHAWTQEALAEKAREIHRLGCELHGRIGTLGGHLGKVGRSLEAAVASYNQAVGSLENRVLVSARRFTELEVTGDDLPSPPLVDALPRPPTALELVEDERSGAGVPGATGASGFGVAPGESA